jgi:hypothetical protein
MDDSLHPKSSKRGKFRVMKFPIKTLRLIHQMWDEMVTMIVIKKDNRMEIIFEATQTNVKGSYVIKVPKKQKKEATMEEKREKMIDNLVMKKYPKGFDEIECKHVNESIKSQFSNYFTFGNKPIESIKVLVNKFLPPPGRIVYLPIE